MLIIKCMLIKFIPSRCVLTIQINLKINIIQILQNIKQSFITKNPINKDSYNKENFIMIISNINQVYKDRGKLKQNVRNFNKMMRSNIKD